MYRSCKAHIALIVLTIVCGANIVAQPRYAVVIHELMADPDPPVGLPNAEWIELRNRSSVPVNLQGFRLAKPNALSGPMPAVILQPDSLLIVCTAGQVAALSAFGRTVSVTSFPALGNAGDLVWLQAPDGRVIHAVSYDISWYGNAVKANGGWSLEMVDASDPCGGARNWRASNDPRGGTPGAYNSMAAANPDRAPPALLFAYAPTPDSILLHFTEPADSAAASRATLTVSDGIVSAGSLALLPPLFNKAAARLPNPLQEGRAYRLSLTGLTDCAGNSLQPDTALCALEQPADSLDLVINEILFHPPPLGYDYLEIYNRSSKALNLAHVWIANRSSSTGAIGSLRTVSDVNRLIFPGEYLALTENPEVVAQQYDVRYPDRVWPLSSMPSYPNERGTAILLSRNGRILDELNYDRRWHFALVDNPQGVALERIDAERPTQSPDNWTSAAASARFGTPGYSNSQSRGERVPSGNVTIHPPVFSPDGDGFDDFALIEFRFPGPGFVANITVYDAAGRPVRVLQRNATCAARGSFRWDGLNDRNQQVPPGNYIVAFEAFNLQGKREIHRKSVTVAKRLR